MAEAGGPGQKQDQDLPFDRHEKSYFRQQPFEESPENLRRRLMVGRSVCLRTEPEKPIMPLLQVLVVLIVVGVLLWLVNTFIPMAGSIKSILNAVVVIATVVWLLNISGLLHSLSRIRFGT